MDIEIIFLSILGFFTFLFIFVFIVHAIIVFYVTVIDGKDWELYLNEQDYIKSYGASNIEEANEISKLEHDELMKGNYINNSNDAMKGKSFYRSH